MHKDLVPLPRPASPSLALVDQYTGNSPRAAPMAPMPWSQALEPAHQVQYFHPLTPRSTTPVWIAENPSPGVYPVQLSNVQLQTVVPSAPLEQAKEFTTLTPAECMAFGVPPVCIAPRVCVCSHVCVCVCVRGEQVYACRPGVACQCVPVPLTCAVAVDTCAFACARALVRVPWRLFQRACLRARACGSFESRGPRGRTSRELQRWLSRNSRPTTSPQGTWVLPPHASPCSRSEPRPPLCNSLLASFREPHARIIPYPTACSNARAPPPLACPHPLHDSDPVARERLSQTRQQLSPRRPLARAACFGLRSPTRPRSEGNRLQLR